VSGLELRSTRSCGAAELARDRKRVEKFLNVLKNFRRYNSAVLPRWAAREILRMGRNVIKHGTNRHHPQLHTGESLDQQMTDRKNRR